MDIILKQRMIGAIVLISLGVIFIPMLLSGKGEFSSNGKSNIPPKPTYAIKPPPRLTIEPEQSAESIPRTTQVIDISHKSSGSDSLSAAAKHVDTPTDNGNKEPVTTNKSVEKDVASSITSQKSSSTNSTAVNPKLSVASSTPAKSAAKTAVAAKAAEKPKSTLKAGWVVQVGSFEKRENANQLRDKLRTKGFAAFVEPRKGETPVFRVRVGPEAKRQSIDQLQHELLNKQKLKGLILKYP